MRLEATFRGNDRLPADVIATLVRDRAGIALHRDKDYLIEGRLLPLLKSRGFASLAGLVAALGGPGGEALADTVVDALTTNETTFFRDIRPFETLRREVLPALVAGRPSGVPLRIWCAAAATGQEPYSLAMLFDSEPGLLAGRPYQILATDISRESLARARDGIYSHFEIQRGLPASLLVRYFRHSPNGRWVLEPTIRDKVRFAEHNLMTDPRRLGPFDLVLCRNVLLYFDPPTKGRALHAVRAAMADHAVLMLGGAESLLGIDAPFAAIRGQNGFFSVRE